MMELVAKKKTFENEAGEQIEYTQYYLKAEVNGNVSYIAVKPVYKDDKRALRFLAKKED